MYFHLVEDVKTCLTRFNRFTNCPSVYYYTNLCVELTDFFSLIILYTTNSSSVYIYIYIDIYIRLKIKPNSVRIRFQRCQIFVLPSTGFEPTPLIHCSTIRLALRPAPQTTRPHPLPIKGASIIVVLPFLVRQIQGQT